MEAFAAPSQGSSGGRNQAATLALKWGWLWKNTTRKPLNSCFSLVGLMEPSAPRFGGMAGGACKQAATGGSGGGGSAARELVAAWILLIAFVNDYTQEMNRRAGSQCLWAAVVAALLALEGWASFWRTGYSFKIAELPSDRLIEPASVRMAAACCGPKTLQSPPEKGELQPIHLAISIASHATRAPQPAPASRSAAGPRHPSLTPGCAHPGLLGGLARRHQDCGSRLGPLPAGAPPPPPLPAHAIKLAGRC